MNEDPVNKMSIERAEELERRAWNGTDDVAYCVKWSGIHRRLAELRQEQIDGK